MNPAQIIAAESADITAYETLPDVMSTVIDRHGLPDLAILSAGVATNSTFLHTPAAEFDRMVNINLSGSREVARALLPGMLQRGSGKVAFVSSIAGLMGTYGYSAYAASKFAVTGMAQALRQELAGTGVSVSLICPGEVNTPMIAAEAEDCLPQTRFLKDLLGTMEPDEVAEKIAGALRKNREVIVPGYRANVVIFYGAALPWHFCALFRLAAALEVQMSTADTNVTQSPARATTPTAAKAPAAAEKHICQVAFSALNGPALRDWYANVFGLVKSGKVVFFPPSTSRVQGLPGAWEKCSWLIDQQDYFQLEFFQSGNRVVV